MWILYIEKKKCNMCSNLLACEFIWLWCELKSLWCFIFVYGYTSLNSFAIFSNFVFLFLAKSVCSARVCSHFHYLNEKYSQRQNNRITKLEQCFSFAGATNEPTNSKRKIVSCQLLPKEIYFFIRHISAQLL